MHLRFSDYLFTFINYNLISQTPNPFLVSKNVTVTIVEYELIMLRIFVDTYCLVV